MNLNNLLKEYLTDLTKEQQTNPTNYQKSLSKKKKVGIEWQHMNGGKCSYSEYELKTRYCYLVEVFGWETDVTNHYTQKSKYVEKQ